MVRRVLLSMSRSTRIRHLVETAPISRSVVTRFVAGTTSEEAVTAVRGLAGRGLLSSLDHLGEDTFDLEHADGIRDAYLRLLKQLGDAGLTGGAEVSVKLSAVGQAIPGRRREGRARARLRDLRGRPCGRHDGDPGHGGPHHHRLHVGHPARPAH